MNFKTTFKWCKSGSISGLHSRPLFILHISWEDTSVFRESIKKEVKFLTSFYKYSNYFHIYVAALYFLEAVALLLLLHVTFSLMSEGTSQKDVIKEK